MENVKSVLRQYYLMRGWDISENEIEFQAWQVVNDENIRVFMLDGMKEAKYKAMATMLESAIKSYTIESLYCDYRK